MPKVQTNDVEIWLRDHNRDRFYRLILIWDIPVLQRSIRRDYRIVLDRLNKDLILCLYIYDVGDVVGPTIYISIGWEFRTLCCPGTPKYPWTRE